MRITDIMDNLVLETEVHSLDEVFELVNPTDPTDAVEIEMVKRDFERGFADHLTLTVLD